MSRVGQAPRQMHQERLIKRTCPHTIAVQADVLGPGGGGAAVSDFLNALDSGVSPGARACTTRRYTRTNLRCGRWATRATSRVEDWPPRVFSRRLSRARQAAARTAGTRFRPPGGRQVPAQHTTPSCVMVRSLCSQEHVRYILPPSWPRAPDRAAARSCDRWCRRFAPVRTSSQHHGYS